MPESKFTEVQGPRMHYLEWGDPANPDLLLVHGWSGFSRAWESVAEAFEDRYHIIAPDHRGHGESDKPETGYHLADFVSDIRQLIDNLGLARPAYVGHSWAGTSARSWRRTTRTRSRARSSRTRSTGR